VLTTCQSWLLTTQIDCDESLFSQKMWMALDRTRYMQSSKTFVMVDRPFWKDKDPETGRDLMSMTLTDRLTRGTYLFDNGDDKPGVICLSYSWMSDALKMLPHPVEKRVQAGPGCAEEDLPESPTSPATSSATRSPCPGKPTRTSSAPSRRAARPLPLQPAHVRALHAAGHARRAARHLHRR
jgi:monoamine oxidase